MARLFDWDRFNLAHVARHTITAEEAQQVLSNDPIYLDKQIDGNSGEERVIEIGHTNYFRVLIVAWTPRAGKTRVVTALPRIERRAHCTSKPGPWREHDQENYASASGEGIRGPR